MNLIVKCSVMLLTRVVLFGSFATFDFSVDCASCKCAKQGSGTWLLYNIFLVKVNYFVIGDFKLKLETISE